jgi:hypothetical protein
VSRLLRTRLPFLLSTFVSAERDPNDGKRVFALSCRQKSFSASLGFEVSPHAFLSLSKEHEKLETDVPRFSKDVPGRAETLIHDSSLNMFSGLL